MKAPTAPNPYDTAKAQTASNQETANYTQGLNMVNQVTPYGNLTYSGTNNGQPGAATATTTLSPEQQRLLQQTQQADSQLNDIGLRQISKAGSILDTPFSIDATAGNKIADMQAQRLDPMFARQSQQLEQDLMNRGIRPGSEAYQAMRSQFDQGKNDAYNSMYINARGQAANEALTERNQPLNEITGLLNGQQIQQPTFQNTPQTQVANTDIAGLIMDNYKNKQSNYNAGMGGLFSLGSAALGGIGGFATGGGSLFGKKMW